MIADLACLVSDQRFVGTIQSFLQYLERNNALLSRLGCRKALTLLHRYYPGGSIKEEIETRKMQLGERQTDEGGEDIEETILKEMLERARKDGEIL